MKITKKHEKGRSKTASSLTVENGAEQLLVGGLQTIWKDANWPGLWDY